MKGRRVDRKHLFNLVFQLPYVLDAPPNETLARYFEHGTRDTEIDRMFIETSFRGVLSRLDELDGKIHAAAKDWDVKRLAATDLAILRVAVYELIFRADIPSNAAFNEAIELAKLYSDDSAPAFINGVLSKIAKEAGIDQYERDR